MYIGSVPPLVDSVRKGRSGSKDYQASPDRNQVHRGCTQSAPHLTGTDHQNMANMCDRHRVPDPTEVQWLRPDTHQVDRQL